MGEMLQATHKNTSGNSLCISAGKTPVHKSTSVNLSVGRVISLLVNSVRFTQRTSANVICALSRLSRTPVTAASEVRGKEKSRLKTPVCLPNQCEQPFHYYKSAGAAGGNRPVNRPELRLALLLHLIVSLGCADSHMPQVTWITIKAKANDRSPVNLI